MNILIVKLSAIGDVVHCLPMAAEIKNRLPQAKITWLVEPPAKALLENNNAVDQVIVFNKKDLRDKFKSVQTLGTGLGDTKSLLTKLSAEHFDLAIDAQGLLKSALLAYFSKAPVRVGFRGAREGSSYLMTDTLDVGDYYGLSRHVVDLNIDLADFAISVLVSKNKNLVPGPKVEQVYFPLPVPETHVQQYISGLLDVKGGGADGAINAQPSMVLPPSAPSEAPQPSSVLDKCPIAVLIPGTTWVTKIWPVEHWSDLGAALLQAGVGRLIICGGKSDERTNQSIYIGIKERFEKLDFGGDIRGLNSGGAGGGAKGSTASGSGLDERLLDLSGKTDLMQLQALFQRSALVVGGDTGPLHLAAATEIPLVVAIHGASPWSRNGPYGKKGRAVYKGIPCQPCFSKRCAIKTIECLRDLEAAQVMDVIGQTF